MTGRYLVSTADNFHSYDEEEGEDESGRYDTAAEAVAAAQAIIDQNLVWLLKTANPVATTGLQLFDRWLDFGDRPVIRPAVGFSPREYAREKAEEMFSTSRSS